MVFRKAADLIAGKYRPSLLAATMLGTGEFRFFSATPWHVHLARRVRYFRFFFWFTSRWFSWLVVVVLLLGKNAWQAEIDAAVEAVDFLRLNTNFAQDIYAVQPPLHAANTWNRLEYCCCPSPLHPS